MKLHVMRQLIIGIISVTALVACKKETGNSQPKAYATPAQALKALQIIKEIDYLPFEYSADGCFARAFYMMIELAVEGVPSSAQFVTARKGMFRYGDISWGYHVAPMMILSDSPESEQDNYNFLQRNFTKESLSSLPRRVFILDPSIAARPLTIGEWLELFTPEDVFGEMTAIPPAFYALPPRQDPSLHLIKSVNEMPKIPLTDIAFACGTMQDFLGRSPERQTKLLRRTKELIAALDKMGKLDRMDAEGKEYAFPEECPFPLEDQYRRQLDPEPVSADSPAK